MKTITVEVTQEDIDEGYPHDCELCPIAMAANRVLGVTDVQVTKYMKWGYIKCMPTHRFALPDAAIAFMNAYDVDPMSVTPFSFTMEIPD